MFCPKCGQQIADDSSFCMHCGNSISGAVAPVQPVVDFQAQKNNVRQSELNALNNAYEYFSQKRSEFEEYDAVCTLVNYYAGGAKSSLLVWGCIILTFGLIALLAVFSEGSADGILGVLLAIMLPASLMIAGGVLMKVNNRKKYAYYQSEYARLSQELYAHYTAYPNCPIGPEYANPDILATIASVLRSGRADTIKESINLLLSDADAEAMNAYLASIEQNTNAINAQTRVAAVFAAANFFLD